MVQEWSRLLARGLWVHMLGYVAMFSRSSSEPMNEMDYHNSSLRAEILGLGPAYCVLQESSSCSLPFGHSQPLTST